MRFADDCDAFEDWRAMRDAGEASLVDAAFRDIIAGKFDTDAVHAALQLGTHPDYHRLKQLLDDAERAARHAGAT